MIHHNRIRVYLMPPVRSGIRAAYISATYAKRHRYVDVAMSQIAGNPVDQLRLSHDSPIAQIRALLIRESNVYTFKRLASLERHSFPFRGLI